MYNKLCMVAWIMVNIVHSEGGGKISINPKLSGPCYIRLTSYFTAKQSQCHRSVLKQVFTSSHVLFQHSANTANTHNWVLLAKCNVYCFDGWLF